MVNHLPENIKSLRNHLKLTQAEFAARFGVNRASVVLYEQGKQKPGVRLITGLCDHFGITTHELYNTQLNPKEISIAVKGGGGVTSIRIKEQEKLIKQLEKQLSKKEQIIEVLLDQIQQYRHKNDTKKT